MIARIRKAVEEKDKGFTLVELLVVIAILGILTAIAVPTFLNQRNKAYDASAKSDVANIGREVATYFVDNAAVSTLDLYSTPSTTGNGSWYLATGSTAPKLLQGTISKDVTLPGTAADRAILGNANTWCVAVTSRSGDSFKYTQAGPGTGDCTP